MLDVKDGIGSKTIALAVISLLVLISIVTIIITNVVIDSRAEAATVQLKFDMRLMSTCMVWAKDQVASNRASGWEGFNRSDSIAIANLAIFRYKLEKGLPQ